MNFTYIPPNFPAPYSPIEITNFSIPANITLPVGGTTAAPAVGSVVQLLAASSSPRIYFLRNLTSSNCLLFFGGDAATWELDIRSPIQMSSGSGIYVSEGFSKLAVFGWCATGGDVVVGIFS